MKILKNLTLTGIVASSFLSAVMAIAADDGQIGTVSSQGEFDITLYNETQIKVFGLTDVNITKESASNALSSPAETGVCVYANVEKYTVSINSNNSFSLAGGSSTSDSIPYSVEYSQNGVTETWGSDGALLAPGVFAGDFMRTYSSPAQTVCSNGDTSIKVNIDPNDYQSADTGVYTDTVMVTVAPI